ncbi:MAG: AAC(3) family N-acetyltransferase [Chloroflexi bacterium]|nr:AAC(3) family N-acetyltransferase [Chloroflexota bacterium]
MTETAVVKKSPHPFTKSLLIEHFQTLGVEAEMTLLVHSSLSKIGYVPGGSIAVIQALQELLTEAGTLVMPTFCGNSDPTQWQNPPVPAEWQQIIRDEMPAFDPQRTPTRMMGAIAELFRTWPNVQRSDHPQDSFAAWGKHAHTITADHQLAFSFGEQSPLARLYDLDGYVLLLGVGYGNNTSFHLAEIRANIAKTVQQGSAVLQNGRRVWQWFDDLDYDDECFPQIGSDFENAHTVSVANVGLAECRLFSQRTAVDFAAGWLKKQIKVS